MVDDFCCTPEFVGACTKSKFEPPWQISHAEESLLSSVSWIAASALASFK